MELVPKKKTMAPVWTYFGLEKNEEGRIKTEDITVCRKCYGHVHVKGGQYLKFSIPVKDASPNLTWICLQCNEV